MAACATTDPNGFLRVDPSSDASNCAALVILSRDDYQAVVRVSEPFDYGQAASLWSFALSSVLLCWFVARGAGTILGLIRRG